MVILVCTSVISIVIHWKWPLRDGKKEENFQIMVKIGQFSIIKLYRKTQKPAFGPHFARTISWEPSLLLTNGKKQQFRTDLYFKIGLSCFLTPKMVGPPLALTHVYVQAGPLISPILIPLKNMTLYIVETSYLWLNTS